LSSREAPLFRLAEPVIVRPSTWVVRLYVIVAERATVTHRKSITVTVKNFNKVIGFLILSIKLSLKYQMQHTSNHSESIRSFIGKKLAIFFRHENTTFFINNQKKNSFLSKTAHFFEQDEDFCCFILQNHCDLTIKLKKRQISCLFAVFVRPHSTNYWPSSARRLVVWCGWHHHLPVLLTHHHPDSEMDETGRHRGQTVEEISVILPL